MEASKDVAPRIRQRQWLNKQRLYGFRGGEDAPRRETDIRDMPPEEEQQQEEEE